MTERHLMHWVYVHSAVATLVRQLEKQPYKINKIVAVSRGGLVPAAFLAQALDVRTVVTISVRSYDSDQLEPVLQYSHRGSMQSKRRSFIETLVYTFLGLAYAIPLNWLMLSKITWPDYWTQATVLTITFTVIGIGFKYVVRRLFNWWDSVRPST